MLLKGIYFYTKNLHGFREESPNIWYYIHYSTTITKTKALQIRKLYTIHSWWKRKKQQISYA
jgi:hypothetical protein